MTLPRGSVAGLAGLETDAAFTAGPGAPLAYNRLADRAVGWVLVDAVTGGPGAQAAAEVVLGLMGGNLTLLAPGRMCNLSFSAPSKLRPPAAADGRAPATLAQGVEAVRASLAEFDAPLRGPRVPFDLVVGALEQAGAALVGAKVISENELAALSRWIRVYGWALHAQVRAWEIHLA